MLGSNRFLALSLSLITLACTSQERPAEDGGMTTRDADVPTKDGATPPEDAGTEDGGLPGECTAPETSCGSECADLSRDVAHCGACDEPCPAWGGCEASSCTAPAFETEEVASADWKHTVVTDADGTVHVFYAHEDGTADGASLRLATRTDGDWVVRTLLDGFPARMGLSTAFAGPDGVLHVCYTQNPSEGAKRVAFVRVLGDDVEEELLFEEVADGPTTGRHCSLARQADGTFHAAVTVKRTGAPEQILHLSRTGPDSWDRSVAVEAEGLKEAELIVADDGSLHMAYGQQLDFMDYELRYAVNDGSGWAAELVDSLADREDQGLVLQEGRPLIVYTRDQGTEGSSASQINLARRSEDGTWTLERVTDERIGYYVDIHLDSAGLLHFAYAERRSSGDSYRPVLAIVRPAGVQRFVLDESFHARSSDVRLSLDATDTPHVSYFVSYPGDLVNLVEPAP